MPNRKNTRYDRERDRRRRQNRTTIVGAAPGLSAERADPRVEAAAPRAETATHRHVSAEAILSGGRPAAVAPAPAEPADDEPRIIRPATAGFRIRPTAIGWLNGLLPKVIRASWREREDLGESGAVTYESTSGLSVRVSGARRADGCRWVYLDVSRLDRDPSPGDVRDARDFVLGPDTLAVEILATRDAHVPRHHTLVVSNCDRPVFPRAASRTDEYA